jgi:transposase-like protein
MARKRRTYTPEFKAEAVSAAHLGTHHTDEARAKMSAAQRRRGTRPPKAGRPWSAEEDELLRTLRPVDVAARTGRTLAAVYGRRIVLGMPDGRAGRTIPKRSQQP